MEKGLEAHIWADKLHLFRSHRHEHQATSMTNFQPFPLLLFFYDYYFCIHFVWFGIIVIRELIIALFGLTFLFY